jgi:signal transduction histidine kinase
MLVKTKILLVISACAVLFLGMFAIWRKNEQHAAETILQGLRESQSRLVSSAMESSYSLPEAFSLNFSYWDDMVAFIEKPSKQWGDENLEPSLSQFLSDACLVVDLNGKVVYSAVAPGKQAAVKADLNLAKLMPLLNRQKKAHFFVRDKGSLYDVSGATVHMTADAERKGKVYGYLLIINVVDDAFINRLEKSTSMLVQTVSSAKVPESDGFITFVQGLKGIDGKEVGYLSFAAPSNSVAHLAESSNRSMMIFALFALTIVGALFLAILGWITRPLGELGHALSISSPAPLAKLLSSKNEFGAVARQVALSFQNKQELEAMLEQKTAAEEALRSANEHLEERVRERTRELEEATTRLSVENAERRLAELRLVEARNLAEAASETKSRFLANMSHEFRTPLNSILGFAELLRAKLSEDAKLNKYTQNILMSGKRLEGMLENMLALAENDQNESAKSGLADVAETLKIVSEISAEAARLKDIKLELDCPENLPLVWGSKDKLVQVFFALAGNAVKFSYPESTVRLSCELSEDGSRVIVCIADHGIGLTAEAKQKIFEQFSQVEDSKERRFQGAGLGLAAAKRLAERMGGEIWVESDGEGKGAKFFVSLPTFGMQQNNSVTAA